MRLPLLNTADQQRDSRSTEQQGDGPADRSTGAGHAARLAEGTKDGFVATLVMTAYRLPVSRSLPPTAQFWAKYVSGGDPDDHSVAAVALHLLYGAIGGAVFGALTPTRSDSGSRGPGRGATDTDSDSRETAAREVLGLAWGSLYALGLSVFGERVVLERLLDEDLDVDERLVFHAGHLVYGLSLGILYGSRTSDEG